MFPNSGSFSIADIAEVRIRQHEAHPGSDSLEIRDEFRIQQSEKLSHRPGLIRLILPASIVGQSDDEGQMRVHLKLVCKFNHESTQLSILRKDACDITYVTLSS